MFIFNHKDKHSKFYKDETIYNNLQAILNKNDIKFKYIDAELKDFPTVLTHKYDLIFLSNIYFYYKENIDEFKQIINKLYTNILTDCEKMIINYEFNAEKWNSPITFDEHKLEIQEVTRKLEEKNIKDSVWIINKPRTKLKEHQEEFCRV